MSKFHVRCYENGIWNHEEPKIVEATSTKQAAERVCGGPLISSGLGKLRAEAWPAGRPQEKATFYSSDL
jgi:hypothetical protein